MRNWVGRQPWLRVCMFLVLGVVALLAALALTNEDPAKGFRSVAPQAIATLMGTFVGAALAFWLNRIAVTAAERERNIMATNQALMMLFTQFGVLMHYREAILDKLIGHPHRHVFTPAKTVADCSHLRIGWPALGFLLQTEHRGVVYALVIVDQKFHAALESIERRARLMDEDFTPRLKADWQKHAEVRVSVEEVTACVGDRTINDLKILTDDVYAQVISACEAISKARDDLLAAATRLFPGETFVTWRPSS